MAVRRMTAEDIPGAARLEQVCFSDPWSPAMLKESLENPLYRFFVDEEAGTLTAYAGMFSVLDEGNIANIAVFPEYRRKGIGEALLSALIRCGYEEGLSVLFLEVRESNNPAISLYLKLGFTETGYRKNYYHEPEEGARIFTKILKDAAADGDSGQRPEDRPSFERS